MLPRCWRPLIGLVLPALFSLFPACAATAPKKEFFFSIPPVSYLRECPDFTCPVVSEIYLSDKVRLLEEKAGGWWRVQSLRDDSVGWTQGALLSEVPLQPKIYYVTSHRLPLRNVPKQEVTSRHFLTFGDKVQLLEESQGWWRVLTEKDRAIGWIPAEAVAEHPPGETAAAPAPKKSSPPAASPPPARPSQLFVAAERATLHLLPLKSSQVLKTLKLNDAVEPIAQSGAQWRKVRFPETGAEGWMEGRLLREAPVTARSHIVTDRKRAPKKPPAPKPPEPAILPGEALEPEGM